MKIYKVNMTMFGREVTTDGITEAECVRVTEKSVFFPGGFRRGKLAPERRESKVSDYHRYFEEYSDAVSFYTHRANGQIKYHQDSIAALKSALKQIKKG